MDEEARNYPPGDMRVSDADRDQALSELSGAYQAGRLTKDEFDQRSHEALNARTGKELTALMADLPQDPVPATRATGLDATPATDLAGQPCRGRVARLVAVRTAMSVSPPAPFPSSSPRYRPA